MVCNVCPDHPAHPFMTGPLPLIGHWLLAWPLIGAHVCHDIMTLS